MEETRIIDFDAATPIPTQALPVGTQLHDGKFCIDRQVGSGGFGITYLAQDSYLERAVVIKECFPEAFCFRFGSEVKVSAERHAAQYAKTVEMFMREARSIAKLRHPNVVTAHQVFEENGTAYMVLDLIEGRDLADIIESSDDKLQPDQIHQILVKVLDAIAVVHDHDLLHRDISPDNILLDKWGSPTLIDFGAAREEASKKSHGVSTMLVVKDGYSPHEFYVAGAAHGPSSDLYALGATMYHLLSGDVPPDSQIRVAALTNNEADPCLPLAGRFPAFEDAFLLAIDKAMSVRPKDRVQTAADWIGLIEHEERKKVPMVNIPASRALSKTLSELIAETNKHVLSAPVPAPAPKEETVAHAAPASRVESFRPAWVEEFNRETLEKAEQQGGVFKNNRHAARALVKRETLLLEQEVAFEDASAQGAQPWGILDWVARKVS